MDEVSLTDSTDESYFPTPDTSTASGESTASFGDLGATSNIPHKEKWAAQKWSKMVKRKKKKTEEKKKKNKISKNDFYAKTAEFKVWLSEVKKVKFETINLKQQKEYFKKFVKKWNTRKLDLKYYRGVLWAVGTPDTQTSWAMPRNVDVTPGSVGEDMLEEKYSRTSASQVPSLGTFGKSTGAAILRELKSMENVQDGTSVDTKQDVMNKDGPKVLSLQKLFMPSQQNCADKKNKQSCEDSWPAPPSPYSTGVPTKGLAHDTISSHNKFVPKMSDVDDTQLPPYPHTSRMNLGDDSNKLIKVNIPNIHSSLQTTTKPAIASKPAIRKTRPMSCIDGALPKRAPTPPKRSSSSENIKAGSWLDADVGLPVSRDNRILQQHRYRPYMETDKLKPKPIETSEKAVDVSDPSNYTNHTRVHELRPVSALKNDQFVITDTKEEPVLMLDMKNGEKRLGSLKEMGSSQKRHLIEMESHQQRSQLVSGEPHTKLIRSDSYASTLSSASCAVFKALSSKKDGVKSGQVTPVRINPSCPYGITPRSQQHDAMPLTVSTDEEILTPGKSSIPTSL